MHVHENARPKILILCMYVTLIGFTVMNDLSIKHSFSLYLSNESA